MIVNAPTYSYTNTIQTNKATICLVSAQVPHAKNHVAVWEGASAWNDSRWIQAGIAQYGDKKEAIEYVEINDGDGAQLSILGTISLGTQGCVTVAIHQRGNLFRLRLDDKYVPGAEVTIPGNVQVIATAESFGPGNSYDVRVL